MVTVLFISKNVIKQNSAFCKKTRYSKSYCLKTIQPHDPKTDEAVC